MKITDFVRLDFKSVRPYFGIRLPIFIITLTIILALFFEALAKIHIPFFSLLILGIMMLTSGALPFSIEQRNNINTFYITQNIPRDTVVTGRFLFGVLVTLIFITVGVLIDILTLIITGNFGGIIAELTAAVIFFLSVMIYNAFSFPIYFKLGFVKGTVLAAFIPMIVIMAVAFIIVFLFPNGFDMPTNINFVAIVFVLTIIALISTYISILLSKKFYKNREF
jgi:hypothetical protein